MDSATTSPDASTDTVTIIISVLSTALVVSLIWSIILCVCLKRRRRRSGDVELASSDSKVDLTREVDDESQAKGNDYSTHNATTHNAAGSAGSVDDVEYTDAIEEDDDYVTPVTPTMLVIDGKETFPNAEIKKSENNPSKTAERKNSQEDERKQKEGNFTAIKKLSLRFNLSNPKGNAKQKKLADDDVKALKKDSSSPEVQNQNHAKALGGMKVNKKSVEENVTDVKRDSKEKSSEVPESKEQTEHLYKNTSPETTDGALKEGEPEHLYKNTSPEELDHALGINGTEPAGVTASDKIQPASDLSTRDGADNTAEDAELYLEITPESEADAAADNVDPVSGPSKGGDKSANVETTDKTANDEDSKPGSSRDDHPKSADEKKNQRLHKKSSDENMVPGGRIHKTSDSGTDRTKKSPPAIALPKPPVDEQTGEVYDEVFDDEGVSEVVQSPRQDNDEGLTESTKSGDKEKKKKLGFFKSFKKSLRRKEVDNKHTKEASKEKVVIASDDMVYDDVDVNDGDGGNDNKKAFPGPRSKTMPRRRVKDAKDSDEVLQSKDEKGSSKKSVSRENSKEDTKGPICKEPVPPLPEYVNVEGSDESADQHPAESGKGDPKGKENDPYMSLKRETSEAQIEDQEVYEEPADTAVYQNEVITNVSTSDDYEVKPGSAPAADDDNIYDYADEGTIDTLHGSKTGPINPVDSGYANASGSVGSGGKAQQVSASKGKPKKKSEDGAEYVNTSNSVKLSEKPPLPSTSKPALKKTGKPSSDSNDATDPYVNTSFKSSEKPPLPLASNKALKDNPYVNTSFRSREKPPLPSASKSNESPKEKPQEVDETETAVTSDSPGSSEEDILPASREVIDDEVNNNKTAKTNRISVAQIVGGIEQKNAGMNSKVVKSAIPGKSLHERLESDEARMRLGSGASRLKEPQPPATDDGYVNSGGELQVKVARSPSKKVVFVDKESEERVTVPVDKVPTESFNV
ncbi:nucleolar protein dao-5-like [Ptychodera flava]|uniref:nucleolar protein dao-5-like n=1 Tax=Ptychodera flava TaxID=63121 RepID=UPI00396A3775